jgi:hypothetical protein
MKSRPPSEDDQLARLGQELKSGTWVKNARHRSRRRRSLWNLLLPLFALPLWVAIAFLLGWVFLWFAWIAAPCFSPAIRKRTAQRSYCARSLPGAAFSALPGATLHQFPGLPGSSRSSRDGC